MLFAASLEGEHHSHRGAFLDQYAILDDRLEAPAFDGRDGRIDENIAGLGAGDFNIPDQAVHADREDDVNVTLEVSALCRAGIFRRDILQSFERADRYRRR